MTFKVGDTVRFKKEELGQENKWLLTKGDTYFVEDVLDELVRLKGKLFFARRLEHAPNSSPLPEVPATIEQDRWLATVTYIDGSYDEHPIEELEDLQAIVEQGPHWATLDNIQIVYNGTAMIGSKRK